MKTAITIPNDLFESADELAQRMGVSRSELYARAVEEYVAKTRGADVTAKLNEVYTDEPRGLDPALRFAQSQSLKSDEW